MRALIVAVMVVAGCHSTTSDVAPDGAAEVGVVTHETPLMAASHVAQDSVVEWSSNPPSSGPHYPTLETWAMAYPIVIPRGNYLHNEEHGGVVLLYNCPGGCADVIENLAALGASLPHDPACPTTMNAKWLMTEDPLLPDGVQVAAAAWGWTYKADSFDAPSVLAFITAHYIQGGSDRDNCHDGVP